MTSRCQLLIFTRYPEAGQVKTRLIPALGPAGAARLQKKLTEKLLGEARLLKQRLDIGAVIHYSGGTEETIRNWLGSINFVKQADGDLGVKMMSAFSQAFAKDADRVVLVGTDIPDLDIDILTQAFTALESSDVVIGPSLDGGYYLLGMTASVAPHLYDQLFHQMTWSTGDVFAATLSRLEKVGYQTAILAVLSDIDNPEDLHLAARKGLL